MTDSACVLVFGRQAVMQTPPRMRNARKEYVDAKRAMEELLFGRLENATPINRRTTLVLQAVSHCPPSLSGSVTALSLPSGSVTAPRLCLALSLLSGSVTALWLCLALSLLSGSV